MRVCVEDDCEEGGGRAWRGELLAMVIGLNGKWISSCLRSCARSVLCHQWRSWLRVVWGITAVSLST